MREARLPFVSLVPGSSYLPCDLVLTTGAEAGDYGFRAMAAEDLDDDPFVLKGQILSRLSDAKATLLIGVDPGTRTGMAVYYGEANLEFATFGSLEGLRGNIVSFAKKVPAKRTVIRIGNGNPAKALVLALSLTDEVPGAAVEVVDEAGTSTRNTRMKGIQGDQRAAAKIAFRKGVAFARPSPRALG